MTVKVQAAVLPAASVAVQVTGVWPLGKTEPLGGTHAQTGISYLADLPRVPSPFVVRDWKATARAYDAWAFDETATGPYLPLGAPVVGDVIPDRGAPGGLHAALHAAATPWVFAAACDMPFVSEAGVALLSARREGAPAVVPRWGGRFEPLHALWSRACLPVFERALRAGDPSLHELARLAGAVEVEEAEWRLVDPAGRAFENANTPEDVARLGLGR